MNFIATLGRHLTLGLCCLCALGQARADATDPSLTIEKLDQRVVVAQDGSFVTDFESVLLINEARAVAFAAQRSLSYNTTLSTLQVLEAYTQKPDGSKIMVEPDQIKDQPERESSGAPMFYDSRVKVIVFPDVAVGDRVAFRYRLKQTTPLYPGQFESMSFGGNNPTKLYRLSYDLPATMTLHADVSGFAPSLPAAGPGRKIYQWDFVPGPNLPTEAGAVDYSDYGRHVFVSTFADFAALAKAYDARASDKSASSPVIAALAAKLTAGLDTPRAKAYALNDWVRRNIRYVATYIGAGGVVPHAADTILANRYGDCKDHATLMEALLREAGIDSTPALINAGNAFRVPSVPLTFNHVITFIPGEQLFLDSTAGATASGYLPNTDIDKTVLLTRTGQMAHTPASQPGAVRSRSSFAIDALGGADFAQSAAVDGSWSETMRGKIGGLKPTDRNRLVEEMLKSRGQRGSGTFEAGRLASAPDALQLKYTGRSENMVSLPGPLGISASSSLTGELGQNVFSMALEKKRSQNFVCYYGKFDEEARYQLAPELSVLAIPKALTLHTADIDYSSDYVEQGNTVLVTRHLEIHHAGGAVCTPADYALMRPALDKMIRDLKAQLILQTR